MYLKHNVKLAPYVWNWSHLISPHTAGLNIISRHLEIMRSFVEFPEYHYDAINTRNLIGGPFINHAVDRKDDVQALIDETLLKCKDLIQLGEDILSFDRYLQDHGKGHSLDGLYGKLPETLKGKVELCYDMNSHPQINFFESLIYRHFYKKDACRLVLEEIVDDQRPFCLSTPYLSSPGSLELALPFDSGLIDELSQMKSVDTNPDIIVSKLGLNRDQEKLFRQLLTDQKPPSTAREFSQEGVRIRYFGHACVLIQSNDMSVLIDPVLGYNYDGKRTDRFGFIDLPEQLDYVVITHNHQDHFLFEVLLQIRHKVGQVIVPRSNTGCLADPSMKLVLKQLGFNNVLELDPLEEISLDEKATLTALPFLGEHGELNIHSKLGYHLGFESLSMLFLADSNNLDPALYDNIFEIIGEVDLLFIGMECVGAPLSWLYGALLSKPLAKTDDRSRRLSGSNYQKAKSIVLKSKCKMAYIYAMGMEPWLGYIMAVDYKPDSKPMVESDQLVEYCQQQSIDSGRLYGKQEWYFDAQGQLIEEEECADAV